MNQQAVTRDEAFLVAGHATTPTKRLYILLLWYTGGRSTEAAALRPENIGINYVVIPNRKQRKDEWKQVFVPAAFADEIREFVTNNGIQRAQYLFSSDKRRETYWSNGTCWSIVTEAAERASVYKVNRYNNIVPAWPHCFRHGAGTHAYRETHDILLVKRQLGHKNLRSTEVYVEVSGEDIAKSVESFNG